MNIYHGDCLAVLDLFETNSIDAIVTDPPYHLVTRSKRFGAVDAAPPKFGADGAYTRAAAGFMGKTWDGGDIAFRVETWAALYRVLKPGGYLLAFGGTRTYHRMACAIEDAGFVTHPMIAWIFGSGFPKATKVKAEGYDGFRYGGQALKPAIEPIYMGQKPFSEKNGATNILKHGTGALNIDGCRVGLSDSDDPRLGGNGDWSSAKMAKNVYEGGYAGNRVGSSPLGRWPANIVHDGSDEVLAAFPQSNSSGKGGLVEYSQPNIRKNNFNRATDRQQRMSMSFGDSGSAARFFYCAKASQADRNEGLATRNNHPTVKPTTLMRYLCRLVTPPGGTILDPFCGSGSTGKGAVLEGFGFIGIDSEADYVDLARARINACSTAPLAGVFA